MLDQLKDWLGLVALLISVGSFFYNSVTSGGSKALKKVDDLAESTSEKIEQLEKEIDARTEKADRDASLKGESIMQRFALLDLQMAKFDEALKHLPDREQSHRLELALAKLTGQMEADARLADIIGARTV